MSQSQFILRLRHVLGLLMAAVAMAFMLTPSAFAQSRPGAGSSNDGAGASTTAGAMALPQVESLPPMSIGMAVDMSLAAPVPPDDLAQLRADLILLVRTLDSMDQRIADHNIEVGFTEEQINAMTDDELTVMYNAIPDVLQFHMAITGLADLLQHPVASRNLGLGESKSLPGRSPLPKMAPGTMALLTNLPFNEGLPEAVRNRGTSDIGACSETRSDDGTVFGLKIVNNSLVLVASALNIACSVFIVIPCPVGTGGKFPPLCIAYGIAAAAQLAVFFAIDLLNVCDTNFTNRTVQASWENTVAIHKNLDAHHMDIMTILEEFRELVIRTGVEENLLLSADLRLSMFQLPEGPHTAVSIQRTRVIVLETIQRNQVAGMPIGNAQAEFDAGESLLALNRYKDAYARYRNAYRAAVGQTIR